MSKLYDREEYLNLTFGLWAAIAAWALGFANVRYAVGVHVVVGLAVAAPAAVSLRRINLSRPRSI